jgi:outer membrane immunogenic protein
MKKLLCAMALAGLLGSATGASAQVQAGPLLAYHTDAEAVGIGAFVGIPIASIPGLAIAPDFLWYFPDGYDFFAINGDLSYTIEVSPDSPVVPFVFAGLNIARFSYDDVPAGFDSSNTEVGLNLGGGVNFQAGSLNPFVGAKFVIQDNTWFVIAAGLSFQVGS